MRARFHVENLSGGERLALGEEVVRHLHVLGLKPGDAITLFDGGGDEALARIETLARRSAEVSILSQSTVSREPDVRVTLACAVPKGRRMDGLVRMVAELGCRRIAPLITARSVVKPTADRSGRMHRWDAICIAASEQSGRNRITVVETPATFEAFLARPDRDELTVLLSPADDAPTLAALMAERADLREVTLIIGPEGGFTPEELDLARSSNVRVARLTPSILRIETAAVAAVAISTTGLKREA